MKTSKGLLKIGRELYFEYHCRESHQSSDAPLWYRSHQKVVILSLDPRLIEQAEGCDCFTFVERGEGGVPLVYSVRFADGHVGDAFEDELLDTEDGYSRPDPPKRKPILWRDTVQCTAAIAAINSATIVAKEQGKPAFVSYSAEEDEDNEKGTYHVGEEVFPDDGQPLCKVNPDGGIDWEYNPKGSHE